MATITWLGGTSWLDASAWDLKRTPMADDRVVIPDLPGDSPVTISSGNVSVNSIAAAETLRLTGGVLTVATTIDAQAGLELAGGTLAQATTSAATRIIAGNTGGRLSGVHVQGDLDVSRYGNANVTIYDGLELNGLLLVGDAAGSTYGRIYFADGSNPAGSLTGSGTVVFGGSVYNFLSNQSNIGGAGGALTLGPSITVRGKNGTISNAYPNGSLVNQGLIRVDSAGGGLSIGGNGTTPFTNSGRIEVASGVLTLNGTTTLVGLGIIERTGGAINLGGTLDLQGATWTLDATTGSWNLAGGAIRNGTLIENDGSLLVITNQGGTLDRMKVRGDLDASRFGNANVTIYGGLELNGSLLVGDAAGSTYGRIYFAD
ncbi:MAG TPA: hypothetical protein PLV92_04980, partial [Pirellulaceae bacterium]|nr:hypothetical protein [Pirellulaceae bacterium]